jgi:hypothetical protein
MSEQELTTLFNLIASVGDWIVFLYLFVTERSAHNETRLRYEERLEHIICSRSQSNETEL